MTQLKVAWDVELDNEIPITGYILEADLNDSGDFVEIWDGQGRPEVITFTVYPVITANSYSFRHKVLNFNGGSEFSDTYTTYACLDPTSPSVPTWVTSTQTSITIMWERPIEDGGCPVLEYKVFRDSGQGIGDADVVTEVHSDILEGKNYITTLEVTDFPANSIGKRFVFLVEVYTKHATYGIESAISSSFILADVPDKPLAAPTRGSNSGEYVIEAEYTEVTVTYGAPVTSYHVDIDDGNGNSFTELQGLTVPDLSLSATKSQGITRGDTYRVRYRAQNEVGFGEYSDISYILAASIPYDPEEALVEIIGDEVTISWQMPYNAGALIYQAQIDILEVDGLTFTEDLTNCDGADQATFDARSCTFLSTVLKTAPYELVQQSPIIPRVKFLNEIGWSNWSTITSPVLMTTVPHKPPFLELLPQYLVCALLVLAVRCVIPIVAPHVNFICRHVRVGLRKYAAW